MLNHQDIFITRKVKIKDIFFGFFLFLEFRLFFIIPLPGVISKINTYHNKILEVILIFFICIIFKKYAMHKFKYTKIVVTYLAIVSLSFIYTLYRYPKADFKEIFVPYCAYWILLFYFPMSQYLRNDINFNRFISMIRGMSNIACCIVIIQALLYNFSGIYFLNIYEFNSGENIITRDGIRITYLSTAVSIALVFSIVELIVIKRTKLKNFITVLLGMVYFIYVAQTRVYIFIFVILMLYAFYFMNDSKKNRFLTVFLVTGTIIIGIWALDIIGYITELIMPMLDGSYIYNGSYYARLESYKYFWSTILKNPLMGLGLMKPSKASNYYHIICGPRGIAYYTDVGLFGLLAEFGVPMVLVFIYMMKKIYVGKNNITNDYYTPYKRIFWLFMLLSCGTLSVLDPQRIIIVALVLAIFDCQRERSI